MPFPTNDPGHAIEQSYLDGVKTDVRKRSAAVTSKDAKLSETLISRVDFYMGRANGADQRRFGNQEYIAGVPQALVSHGRDAMERGGGGLLKFWDETMRPAMQGAVDNDPNRRKLNRSGGPGKPYKPDDPWGKPDDLKPDAMAQSVMSKINFDNGSHAAGMDYAPGMTAPYSPQLFQLPQGYTTNKVAVSDADDANALIAKLNKLKGDLTQTMPGWYDQLLPKVNQALAVNNPDRQTLVNLITAINADIEEGAGGGTGDDQAGGRLRKAAPGCPRRRAAGVPGPGRGRGRHRRCRREPAQEDAGQARGRFRERRAHRVVAQG